MTPAQIAPQIVGLKIEEAHTISQEAGFTIRVMREDGESRVGTCDYRLNRINVATQQGEIIEILNVG